MLDHHVDEFDLGCGRGASGQEFRKCFGHRSTIKADQRAHKTAKTITGLSSTLDVLSFTDPSVKQHLLKLGQIGGRQRLALPQLMQHDVILMCAQKMPRLCPEAGKVAVSELS